MRVYGLIGAFLLFHTLLWGQALFVAKVDSTSMVIGDQQNLTLTFTEAVNATAPEFLIDNLDTCKFFEIISQSQWIKIQNASSVTIEKKIRFTVFEEGTYLIPSLFARMGTDTIRTYSIPIQVMSVEPDTTGLRPIKGIIKERKNWTDYIEWLLSGLALLLAYLIYRYVHYKKKWQSDEIIVPVEIIKQPHEIALEKLGVLKESKLWEKGQVKDFHSQLTYIIREYLENRYQIPALESTSMETIRDVKKHITEDDLIKSIDDTLHIADWVKFAQGIPELNANELALDRAIELVLVTKSESLQTSLNE